jgi:hypothetical protein
VNPSIAARRLLEGWGPWLAAAVAAAAALPGLAFPFLADDWLLVDAARRGQPPLAPYGYFRPLYTASFWVDWKLWGASPAFFHFTNLLLLAAAAALVVVVIRVYTGSPLVAAVTGVLFALHPYHVENAAWIAVRGDPFYSVLLLLALLAYERWRRGLDSARAPAAGLARGRGPDLVPRARPARARAGGWAGAIQRAGAALPFAALALFEAALLVKESAVTLPILLIVLGAVDASRRARRVEWQQGLVPLLALAALHFLVVRPWFLAGEARSLAPRPGLPWLRHLAGYAVAAIVPVGSDWLAARPLLWGGIAAAAIALLVGTAWLRSGAPSRPAAAALALFGVLLLPSMIGFQERYLYLPAAAFCLGLAFLLRDIGGAPGWAAGLLLAAGWTAGAGVLWSQWHEAAVASRSLVSGLVEASRSMGVKQIVVANMPFRVRGGSVAGNFRSALALSGGVPVEVMAVAYVSYPRASSDCLDTAARDPVRTSGRSSFVRLRVPAEPYCRYVGPGSREDGAVASAGGKVFFESDDRIVLRLDSALGRSLHAWIGGRLVQLR